LHIIAEREGNSRELIMIRE